MKVERKGRSVLTAILCGGALAIAAGAAQADPVSFLPPGQLVQFKYNNFENLITEEGQELRGIFNVSSIQDDPGGSTTFWAGNGVSDGTQLTGVFKGLIAGPPTPDGGGGFNIKFTGGQVAFYNVPNGSFSTATGPGNDATLLAQACGGACPTPWLTANFDSGIVVPNDGTTLFSNVSQLTGPATGTGFGYLSVANNSWGNGTNNAFFDTNGQTDGNGGLHDLFLGSNIVICDPQTGAGSGCVPSWPVASFDPVHTGTSAVPEPTSLLLLGAGLTGLGVWRRMKKA